MKNVKYYFKYDTLNISLPKSTEQRNYSCYNLSSDDNINDLFKLTDNEHVATIISDENIREIFIKNITQKTQNCKIIDLTQKPELDFFQNYTHSGYIKINRTIAQVFNLVLKTDKYQKVIMRMLNSFTSTRRSPKFKDFIENYLLKISVSEKEFQLESRMQIYNYFHEENPQFLHSSSAIEEMSSYYYNLNKLNPLDQQVYSIIMCLNAKGAVFLDFKTTPIHSFSKNGYFFYLKDKKAREFSINFNLKEDLIKRKFPAKINQRKIVGGLKVFDNGSFQDSVPYLFEKLFINYSPVESLASLINDPNLSHFFYEHKNHLICIINSKSVNLDSVKYILEKYSKIKHISLVHKDPLPDKNSLKKSMDYPSIDYYDFLTNEIKNIIFTCTLNDGKKSIYIELPIDSIYQENYLLF